MKILITGSAGFIEFSLTQLLLKKKFNVTGIDNFDNYYSPKYKKISNLILTKEKILNYFTIKKVLKKTILTFKKYGY